METCLFKDLRRNWEISVAKSEDKSRLDTWPNNTIKLTIVECSIPCCMLRILVFVADIEATLRQILLFYPNS